MLCNVCAKASLILQATAASSFDIRICSIIYFIDSGMKMFEGHFPVVSARSDEQIINARSGHRNCRLS